MIESDSKSVNVIPEVLEADEFAKEATIRWTGLEKRTKLPGHITTTRNTMTCVERNNVSVQTDMNAELNM
jgi:hypothetical protein